MRYLRSIITWIDSLESGRQFRSWAAILVKILAVVVFVGISVWSIASCIDTITAGKDLEMISSILVVVGSILEVCLNITLAIIVAFLFWNRSNKIRTLDNDPNFILISIAVILVQLLGEVMFFALLEIGIRTLVSSIFGSGVPKILINLPRTSELMNIFPIDPRGNITFISSVIVCIIFVLSGPVILVVSYFIAEEINVLANIAESLNNIETKLVSEEPASDSQSIDRW